MNLDFKSVLSAHEHVMNTKLLELPRDPLIKSFIRSVNVINATNFHTCHAVSCKQNPNAFQVI